MIPARALLPARLTPDEARGFRIACACMATWGMQLAAEPSLPGSAEVDHVRARFRGHGRVVAAMASALDRQLGQDPTSADIPIEAVAKITGP